MLRTHEYDTLPCRSYSHCKEGKNEDFAYQQQVEIKNLLRTNVGKGTFSFLMLSDWIYDYGEKAYFDQKLDLLSFVKSIVNSTDRSFSMLFTYFISEILLWLVIDTKSRPILIQSGAINWALRIKKVTEGFISVDNKLVGKDLTHNYSWNGD